jgi:hypothetical protein
MIYWYLKTKLIILPPWNYSYFLLLKRWCIPITAHDLRISDIETPGLYNIWREKCVREHHVSFETPIFRGHLNFKKGVSYTTGIMSSARVYLQSSRSSRSKSIPFESFSIIFPCTKSDGSHLITDEKTRKNRCCLR